MYNGGKMKIKLLKIKKSMLIHLNNLSKVSVYILIYGLLLCTVYFVAVALFYLLGLKADSVAAIHNYSELLQYVLMSILLVICGAFLFDIVIKSDKNNKK